MKLSSRVLIRQITTARLFSTWSSPWPEKLTGVARKKQEFAKPFQTAEQILDNPMFQTILSQHNIQTQSPTSPLDKPSKIAVLAHLSHTYEEPVPSNVLPDLKTLADVTQWFSNQLKPIGAMPHTRRLLRNTIGASDELDERIDLETEQVHQEFLEQLPPNLTLDRKLYRKADPVGLKGKRGPPRKKMRAKKKHAQRPSASA